MVGQSALSVVATTVESARRPWVPALAVVRWITQPRIVQARWVSPGPVTTAARRAITARIALSCKATRVRVVERLTGQSRDEARPQHLVFMNYPRMWVGLSLSERSLVIF